jgi:hypothetical protein
MDMKELKELIEYLVKEGQVIKGAPVAFIVALLLAGGVVWLVVRWRYEGIVQTLNERIEAQKDYIDSKDALIIEYRQRLHLAPTDETRYSVMSNSELHDAALKVSGEIRAYAQESNVKQRQLSDSHITQMRNAATDEDRKQIWQGQTAQLTQVYYDMNATYDKKYKVSASLLRDELIRRLPENYNDKKQAHFYARPTNMLGMLEVAADLEKLARSLP